jgi:hypothetical protein
VTLSALVMVIFFYPQKEILISIALEGVDSGLEVRFVGIILFYLHAPLLLCIYCIFFIILPTQLHIIISD